MDSIRHFCTPIHGFCREEVNVFVIRVPGEPVSLSVSTEDGFPIQWDGEAFRFRLSFWRNDAKPIELDTETAPDNKVEWYDTWSRKWVEVLEGSTFWNAIVNGLSSRLEDMLADPYSEISPGVL